MKTTILFALFLFCRISILAQTPQKDTLTMYYDSTSILKDDEVVVPPSRTFVLLGKCGKYHRTVAWKNGKVGLLDSEMKALLPTVYDSLRRFNLNCNDNTSRSYIILDSTGYKGLFLHNSYSNIKMLPCKFDKIWQEDYYLCVEKNKQKGMFSYDGEPVLLVQYDEVYRISSDYWAIKKDGFWGYLNTHNHFIQAPIFDEIKFGNQALWYKKGNQYGLIQKDIINKNIYDNIDFETSTCFHLSDPIYKDSFSIEGYFFVAEKNKKKGLIDGFDSRTIIPFQYDFICQQHFRHGVFFYNFYIVKKGSLMGLLAYNHEKDKVSTRIPLKYTSIECNGAAEEVFFIVKNKHKKVGIISIDNKIIVPCEYDDIQQIFNGYKLLKNNQTMFLNHNYKIVPHL